MAGERTNRKRLDDIEVQIGSVKKELGDVKKQVTNDIPHKLDGLIDNDVKLLELVAGNGQTMAELALDMKKVGKILSRFKFPGA